MSKPPAKTPAIVETRWWWVRHAPVPDGGRVYGQGDLDCDCSDGRVFAALAAALPADAVWLTSHLKRTRQTARAIAAASGGRHDLRAATALPELAEQHLGDWQGQDRQSFRSARNLDATSFWFSPATERAPGGESYADLVARVQPVVAELTRTYAGRDIVAVTHGGTIRAALGHALGLSADAVHAFTIENCSLTRLDHLSGGVAAAGPGGRWRVTAVNHRPWTARAGGSAGIPA